MDINVHISNPDYFNELLAFPQVTGIYVEQERVTPEKLKKMVGLAHEASKKLYVALPFVWNEEVGKVLSRRISSIIGAGVDGYLIRNLDELGLLSDRAVTGLKILDAGMYTWNTSAIAQLESIGADYFTAPYELNSKELRSRGFYKTEIVAYGYYPMMISNNCLKLTTGKCAKEKDPYGNYHLKDRTGAYFNVTNCCTYCYNIIYNSVPTHLLDEREIYRAESVRLSFTTESRLEMKTILSRYFSGDASTHGNITRGHFKRGAE